MTVRLLCKNNKYQDFGNHTGLKWKECTHQHLTVGKHYTFTVSLNGKRFFMEDTIAFSETIFYKDSVNSYNRLYDFFYSIEEMRNSKFNKIKNA